MKITIPDDSAVLPDAHLASLVRHLMRQAAEKPAVRPQSVTQEAAVIHKPKPKVTHK